MYKKIIVFVFSLFLSVPLSAENNDTSAVIDDLTVIVNSCDKYKDCWQPFCTLLHRYWPGLKTHNSHIPVILITNEAPFSFPGITVLKTGEDKSWSDNMLQALSMVKTKKVLYLQEDYFFNQPMNEQVLKNYIGRLDDGTTGYTQITGESYFDGGPIHPVYKDSIVKPRFMNYRTSLQPALWLKDLLVHMIKPGENPWKFELDGSIRSDGSPLDFLTITGGYPFNFVNGCANGFWAGHALDFLKKEGLEVTKTSLPNDRDYAFAYKFKLYYPRFYRKYAWLMSHFDDKYKNDVRKLK